MKKIKSLSLALIVGLVAALAVPVAYAADAYRKAGAPAAQKHWTARQHQGMPKALKTVKRLSPGNVTAPQRPAVRAWDRDNRRPLGQQISSVEGGKIYGGSIYADNWTTSYQPIGIYAFEKNDGSTLEGVKLGDDYVVTGGGFFANGKYYFVSYMEFMGFFLADMYTVDFETWEIVRDLPIEVGSVAQDMAYDPTTGNVYGCFMNDDGDAWIFGVMEIETGHRTKLSDLDVLMVTVAVNSKGDVYGVGLDGALYKFDKITGAKQKIGDTGRKPMYAASGCFDLKTDTFYWECIEADAKGNLYTIDLNTGAATYVTTLANNMEMTGMFIPMADAEDEAPAAVGTVEFDFEPGAKSGDIVFTMPYKRFNSENPLESSLDWTLTVNDTETFNGNAAPGAEVRVPYSSTVSGTIRVAVYTENAGGRSPITTSSTWIGNDSPRAVTNLQVKRGVNPGEFVVSWDAPKETAHGGYVDVDNIKYDVVRMPEDVKVANSISETYFSESFDDNADMALHYYVVTPIFEGEAGEPAASPEFGTGSIAMPYRNYFDQESDFAPFTVEDTNGDGETWKYDAISEAARIKYGFYVDDEGYHTPEMDDWFFTPPVRLKAGRMIRLSVDSKAYYGAYGSVNTEKFEVKLGAMPVSTAMTEQVIGVTTVTNTDPVTYDGFVSVENDGLYYFGIHGCSPADQLYLYIDNLMIEEGPLLGTPGDITNLKAVPGANGALEATISFNAPSKTVDGKDLTKIDRIEIRRYGQVVHAFDNPAPGAALSYTDATAKQGDNVYTVVPINEIGEGYEATVSVYVGHDRPGLPVNVHATEVDGNVVLTWQAPLAGETGGYYNPADVTYTIVRANDEAELATGVKELTFTDKNPPLNGFHHEFFTYYVYAQSPAGYGYGLASNSVCVGQSFEVPFAESFSDGKLAAGPWDVVIPEESYGYWQIVNEGQYPTASPQDRDGGLVTFIPSEEGDSGRLISGKISMKGVDYPALDFWYYAYPGVTDRVYVYVNPDDKGESLVDMVNVGSQKNEGWVKASMDLSKFANADNIQIIFNAVSADAYSNVHLDNIRIHETYDNNLSVTGIQVPSRMMSGEKSTVTVEVSNLGLNSISDYTVELYRNGELESTMATGRLTSGAVQQVAFEVVPTAVWGSEAKLKAVVKCAADEYEGDNASEEVTVEITDLNFPAVNDLTATRDDESTAVTLEWSEPEFVSGSAETIVEDVEDMKAFSIDNFGDWTVIDGDMMQTYGIDSGNGQMLTYENAGKPMAFMAFNPSKAGIPVEEADGTPTEWAPHSGDQYFASFAVAGKNDDWLISPLLPGMQQEISFWVRSLTADYGYEKYEVYYSTSGIDREDFTRIGDVRSAPIVWVEDKVVLPEGTRYFAIRCVSEDAYVFMLDDIKYQTASTYMGELSFMGYNVYRDLQLLTERPIMEQTYVDTAVDALAHTYNVTVVYDLGESRLSNDATVVDSGVKAGAVEGLRVECGNGFMIVTAEAGTRIEIYEASGVLRASFISSGRDYFDLSSGVYMVVADKRGTMKVIVR